MEIIQAKKQTSLRKMIENDPRLTSARTTDQYRYNLIDFNAWRNRRPITKTLVEQYAIYLKEAGLSLRTINQRLASIRWYARRLVDVSKDNPEEIESDPQMIENAARVATVRDLKGDTAEAGRHLAPGELTALLQAAKADKTAQGKRDAAMIAIAWSTGLRREEIAGIDTADLAPEEKGTIRVKVMGKGQKFRLAYINDGALIYFKEWMDSRGNDSGKVFCKVNKSNKVTISDKAISGEAMRKILRRLTLQAGLAESVTWHDFRRTFAGNLYAASIDGPTVQKLMGHASQNQTAKYDRRAEETRMEAVKVLHIPFYR